ncbi:MAG: hypothetical protein IKR63_07525, partial [Alloprevotella sp.]|nr:hypothetical protein [Alloprevotella sp.]
QLTGYANVGVQAGRLRPMLAGAEKKRGGLAFSRGKTYLCRDVRGEIRIANIEAFAIISRSAKSVGNFIGNNNAQR